MTERRIELTLFGEGESSGVCAAEQTANDDNDENRAEGICTENKAECKNDNQPGQRSADFAVIAIAQLLGIDAEDNQALIAALKSRMARAELSERLKRRNAQRMYESMLSESDRLSKEIEGFDLAGELKDKRFLSFLKAGIGVEEAWRAVHMDALIEEARKDAKAQAVSEIYEKLMSTYKRPSENGSSGKAPAKSQQSVESLTGKGIRDILRRVENGAKIKF